MRLRRTLTLAVAVAAVVALCPVPARADDDPRKVRAEAVFQEGVRMQSQGRSADALAKLKEAYEIYPSPNTLAGIARVEHSLGRSLEAIRHYREALRNPLTHPENAEYAKRAIAELEKRLARIDVRGPTGLVVKIGDRDLVLPLVEPVDVEPSPLKLRGTLAGATYEGEGTATVGRLTTIDMAAASAAAPALGAIETTPPSGSEPGFWTGGRIAGAAIFGVGLVGLGVGIGFGASSGSEADRADGLSQKLGPAGCSAGAASADCAALRDARDAQDSHRTISGATLISGGVLAAAGIVLFLVSSPRAASGSTGTRGMVVVPELARGSLGVSVQSAF